MFKKGQKVFLIRAWNSKATVYITPAIVEGCGKKQMTLRAEDGTMLGRNFRPQEGQYGSYGYTNRNSGCVNVAIAAESFADRAAVEAKAIVQAAFFREMNIEHYETLITRNPDASKGYLDNMKKELEAVRASAPTFIWRGEAK